MLEWLETFGNAIVQVSHFVVAFFRNVVELVILIFKGFTYVSTIISYLPVQYQIPILAFVSFAVIVTVVHFGE